MALKVLVADDSEVVCKGIRSLLLTDPEIELIGEADYRMTVELANTLQPDVVVLDVRMPDGLTFDAFNVGLDLDFRSHVVAISFANDENAKKRAKLVGAASMLDKTNLGTKLTPAIKRAARIPLRVAQTSCC
jgi:two-component system, NarL family, response regulator LiaR